MNQMDLKYWDTLQPGDIVRLSPKQVGGPSIEGVIAVATATYVNIRGLGFTQFDKHGFTLICTGERVPPKQYKQVVTLYVDGAKVSERVSFPRSPDEGGAFGENDVHDW